MKSYSYLCGMARYSLNTSTSKATKIAVKKFGSFEIDNFRVKGSVEIVNYRKYQSYEEVDIVFKGKIRVRVDILPEWYDSETIKSMGRKISKIKLNRFIKKSCFFDVRNRMNYFGSIIKDYSHIKKIQWI